MKYIQYIRDLVCQVLLYLGVLLLVSPLYSLVRSEFRWRGALVAVVVGAVFFSGGLIVLKRPSLQGRPRYWATAVSGLICSVCTLLLFVSFFVVYRWPADKAPDWLILIALLFFVVGGLAAMVCIATGTKALFKPSLDQSE